MIKDFFNNKVEQWMSWVVPDIDSCRGAAQEILSRSPAAPREELAMRVIEHARKQGLTVGGLTGLASSPITMVPAAMADIAAMMKVEGMMAGVIAAILDPASLEDAESFRADVLAVVFPAAISQAVRQLGIRAGEQMTKKFIRRTMEKEGIETVVKLTGRFMGARFTGKAIATKGVPLVGAGIGAGWNWLEVSAVGKRAIAYHTGQPMTAGKLSDWGKRLIPHRFRKQAP